MFKWNNNMSASRIIFTSMGEHRIFFFFQCVEIAAKFNQERETGRI